MDQALNISTVFGCEDPGSFDELQQAPYGRLVQSGGLLMSTSHPLSASFHSCFEVSWERRLHWGLMMDNGLSYINMQLNKTSVAKKENR
jgi:hypothetical protein